METRVERLRGTSSDDFQALLADSERSGVSFLRRRVDEWRRRRNPLDRPGEALLGARADGETRR